MKRVHGWDGRLVDWERSVLGEPFRWGATDCGSLVRGVLTALYGEDAADPGVREYTTARGALEAHEATGGIEAVLRSLGAREVGLSYAQQGDVLVESPSDEETMGGAGVVVAREVVHCPEGETVDRTPLRAIRAADEGEITVLRLP